MQNCARLEHFKPKQNTNEFKMNGYDEREERSYRRNRYKESQSSRNGRSESRFKTRERCRFSQSGMMMENGVFLNDGLRNCSENNGQIIIVDSGCPRSLMGNQRCN